MQWSGEKTRDFAGNNAISNHVPGRTAQFSLEKVTNRRQPCLNYIQRLDSPSNADKSERKPNLEKIFRVRNLVSVSDCPVVSGFTVMRNTENCCFYRVLVTVYNFAPKRESVGVLWVGSIPRRYPQWYFCFWCDIGISCLFGSRVPLFATTRAYRASSVCCVIMSLCSCMYAITPLSLYTWHVTGGLPETAFEPQRDWPVICASYRISKMTFIL